MRTNVTTIVYLMEGAILRSRGTRTAVSLAARMGVSKARWNQYESAHTIHLDTVRRIARVLGCPLRDLVD